MFFRKLTFLAGLFLALCLFAPSAHAQVDNQDYSSDPCFSVDYSFGACGGGGWGAGGNPIPPTITTCSASASLGQQCRVCSTDPVTPTNPNPTAACGYTRSSGACKCKPESGPCTSTEGACLYSS